MASMRLRYNSVMERAVKRTDSEGNFALADIEPGTYQLQVFESLHRETVTVDGDLDLRIELPLAEIRGQVVEADSGTPVTRADVWLEALSDRGRQYSHQQRRAILGRWQHR